MRSTVTMPHIESAGQIAFRQIASTRAIVHATVQVSVPKRVRN